MNKKFEWVDSLRGFACILVLIGHIPNLPNHIFMYMTGFVLPSFFVLSGYLFNFEKWGKIGLKELIISRFKSLILPFISSCLLVLALYVIKLLIINHTGCKELLSISYYYLRWIVFQPVLNNIDLYVTALWFLPTLFFSTIFLFLLLKTKAIFRPMIIAFFIIITKIICHYSIDMPWHVDVALIGCLYMFVGYLVNKYKIFDKSYIFVLLLVLLCISFLSIYSNHIIVDLYSRIYNNYYLMYMGGVGISLFLIWIFKHFSINNKYLKTFGRYSIVVIAFNFIVNDMAIYILELLSIKPFWYNTAIIVILVFSLIVLLLNKFFYNVKVLNFIIGKR